MSAAYGEQQRVIERQQRMFQKQQRQLQELYLKMGLDPQPSSPAEENDDEDDDDEGGADGNESGQY